MVPLRLQIDDSFFLPESRNGYLVSSEMKKVWAVELDLLNEFTRVCEVHHLKWFAHAGTMLGAIRHNGFIPWDDDIDVVMPREDYIKLCSIGPTVFTNPYFFQTEETDRFFCRSFARIRNSQTTAIQLWEKEYRYPYNQGIFIDVFPIDNVPNNVDERTKYYEQVSFYHDMAWQMRNFVYFYHIDKTVGINKLIKRHIKHLLYKYIMRKKRDYLNYLAKCEKLTQMYNGQDTIFLGESIIPPLGRWIWEKEWIERIEYVPFEMLMIPVPIGYEECLRSGFGDNWRIPRQVPNLHGDVLFDTDTSYTEYLKS